MEEDNSSRAEAFREKLIVAQERVDERSAAVPDEVLEGQPARSSEVRQKAAHRAAATKRQTEAALAEAASTPVGGAAPGKKLRGHPPKVAVKRSAEAELSDEVESRRGEGGHGDAFFLNKAGRRPPHDSPPPSVPESKPAGVEGSGWTSGHARVGPQAATSSSSGGALGVSLATSSGGAPSSSSASSSSAAVAATVINIPQDVLPSGSVSVEDLADSTMAGPTAPISCLSSLSMGASKDFASMMSVGKCEMIEVAKIAVRRSYLCKGLDISEVDVANVASLQVELGACDILEVFSPRRFTASASQLGLKAGYAIDLSEQKLAGPHVGEHWDLARDRDVKELEYVVEAERPFLLTGSPPCDPFSQLLAISEARRDPAAVRLKRELGMRHLKTSVAFYKMQIAAGRYFLHEHPAGATSWDEPVIQQLQLLPGVFTVQGPMCAWSMKMDTAARGCLHVYKRTRWITNSPVLARLLDTVCSNSEGKQPWHVHHALLGGIAKRAAAYPPALVTAVLKGIKQQMLDDGCVSDLDLAVGGPVPSDPAHATWSEEAWTDVQTFFDEMSGEQLPTTLVHAARKEEISWVNDIGLYDKVPRQVAIDRGIKPVSVRWVDVNKGDRDSPKIRSRLVGRELKAKTKDSLLAHSLFSAMPPWETIKSLLSLLVTDGVCTSELEVGIFDISRAHFQAPAARELYIELPSEDLLPQDGDAVGRLKRSMYGFRDASHEWMRDWQKLLEGEGYAIGVANPALFYNKERESRGAVHGDDFYVLGPKASIDHVGKTLASKYSVRESHRLGFGAHCVQEATVLNRVVILGVEGGRKFVQIEPDARHVELILADLGLDAETTKPVATPGLKQDDGTAERRKGEPQLSPANSSKYRSCVMRAAFLAQDRADLGEAVGLAQSMSRPVASALADLKHLGRYLCGRPLLALRFDQQELSKCIRTSVDSDHAADKATRKSTTGMVQRLGMHVVKATSNLQSAIGLNVSEAEFYALVQGCAHGLSLQAFLRDLGLEFEVVIESDSTSAKAFASRLGLGKQRHVQTRYLWIQAMVSSGRVKIVKVATHSNVSDILTKAIEGVSLRRHLLVLGYLDAERHALHKRA